MNWSEEIFVAEYPHSEGCSGFLGIQVLFYALANNLFKHICLDVVQEVVFYGDTTSNLSVTDSSLGRNGHDSDEMLKCFQDVWERHQCFSGLVLDFISDQFLVTVVKESFLLSGANPDARCCSSSFL